MTHEQEKFIKHFKEERNNLRDPEIFFDGKVLSLNSIKINKLNLIGELFILIYAPAIICFVIIKIPFAFSIQLALIGFALIWIIIVLKERINRIKLNNNIQIDLQNDLLTVTPIDYLRKDILKKESTNYTFTSFNTIATKRRKFDKLNAGIRIMIDSQIGKTNLIDIWTKSLGENLSELIAELTKKKLNDK
ncbi:MULTISPECIES: hypothetical protein [Bizionia]|uniref:Uncharacterized protein n=1 Tax=Bizionia algoritergicola TaxID=291187 RepID=A0A5D0QQQ9_9FLAO|nr:MULTISPECIES: hypothetical protein [Bizionia]OBX17577.1 hypothetical protein BAA08_16040 [Bizionia sp. APA-3]TYB71537.1 hypothetical protein ES675_13355 [Bizionia algoritergicola]